MESLRTYLNGKPVEEQEAYAKRCGTSIGYLRKVLSTGQKLNTDLVILLDRESGGEVPCDELRPDVDWEYLRRGGTSARKPKRSN